MKPDPIAAYTESDGKTGHNVTLRRDRADLVLEVASPPSLSITLRLPASVLEALTPAPDRPDLSARIVELEITLAASETRADDWKRWCEAAEKGAHMARVDKDSYRNMAADRGQEIARLKARVAELESELSASKRREAELRNSCTLMRQDYDLAKDRADDGQKRVEALEDQLAAAEDKVAAYDHFRRAIALQHRLLANSPQRERTVRLALWDFADKAIRSAPEGSLEGIDYSVLETIAEPTDGT